MLFSDINKSIARLDDMVFFGRMQKIANLIKKRGASKKEEKNG